MMCIERLRVPLGATTLFVLLFLAACGGGGGSGSGGGGSTSTSSISVTTIAGTSRGADGVGTAALFSQPSDIVSDGTYLYVTDSANNSIRRIAISTGLVSTLAGKPMISTDSVPLFARPEGITRVGGNLYVADRFYCTIFKVVIATGETTPIAGHQPCGSQSGSYYVQVDGIGTAAVFADPRAIANDGTNLYVVDAYTIRKIEIATGVVTTFAGSAGMAGSTDGIGTAARFGYWNYIVVAGANLYVTDGDNGTIRQIELATGVVTTIAGSAGMVGSVDGIGAAARLGGEKGVTSDGANLYFSTGGSHLIRKMNIATKAVTTIAGAYLTSGSTDGTGASARFSDPHGMAIDGTNLYVTDYNNATIRKVDVATNTVTTFAGQLLGQNYGYTDGTGTAAKFYQPTAITSNGSSLFVTNVNLYNTNPSVIRQIDIATSTVTTLAGNVRADGITSSGTDIFVADSFGKTISRIAIATGAVTVIAGSGTGGSADGTGTAASFANPNAISNDGINLYVADNGNCTIRKIVIATGAVSTLAGVTGSCAVLDTGNAAPSPYDSRGRFYSVRGITNDGANLYITDENTIRKVVIATGNVTTIAGGAYYSGANVDGTGLAARFWVPKGISYKGGNLYVADTGNNTIRKIEVASGVVTTVAGHAGVRDFTDGIGTAAQFYSPAGIASDGTNLYVADTGNHVIRKLQ